MIVLADNDILLKLARCDLFDEFLKVFDISQTDVYIVPTVRFSLEKINENESTKRVLLGLSHSYLISLTSL